MEEHLIYGYSLCAALSLMLFFGIYMILGKTPDKPIFETYIKSRRTIGVALLILSANYAVHLFLGIRFINHYSAILMNLSTYFICYWLFSSAMRSLLEKNYVTRKKNIKNILRWVVFTLISAGIMFLPERIAYKKILILLMGLWLFIYGVKLATSLILCYRRSVKQLENSHSDDIEAYIHWLSVTTYWALIFGVGCSLFTFLPDRLVVIWILSSIPFYVYLYYSYMNYLIFYEQVEQVLEMAAAEDVQETDELNRMTPSFHTRIEKDINKWVEADGYVKQGLTIEDMAESIGTNRTYLSEYINSTFNMTFREWITGLRLEYAKKMLVEHNELTIAGVAEKSGFLSLSYFTKIFTEKEKCSPAKWRKNINMQNNTQDQQ